MGYGVVATQLILVQPFWVRVLVPQRSEALVLIKAPSSSGLGRRPLTALTPVQGGWGYGFLVNQGPHRPGGLGRRPHGVNTGSNRLGVPATSSPQWWREFLFPRSAFSYCFTENFGNVAVCPSTELAQQEGIALDEESVVTYRLNRTFLRERSALAQLSR